MAGLPPADPDKFEEAIEAFRKRVPMTRKEWDALTEAQREHAFMVSEVARADVVSELCEAVDKAIEHGTTFAEFKDGVGELLESSWGGPKPGRLETIFRTNVQTAYNAGRHAVFSAPAVRKARPYLRFDGVEDDRQTDICEACNGVVLPADDPYWNSHTPPLHFNCRSTVVALSSDEADDEGVTDDPPEEDADDGFGRPPSTTGADWEPDLTGYPKDVGGELRRRLEDGPGEE